MSSSISWAFLMDSSKVFIQAYGNRSSFNYGSRSIWPWISIILPSSSSIIRCVEGGSFRSRSRSIIRSCWPSLYIIKGIASIWLNQYPSFIQSIFHALYNALESTYTGEGPGSLGLDPELGMLLVDLLGGKRNIKLLEQELLSSPLADQWV